MTYNKYLIWDFDGTLGYREGIWSGALAEVVCRKFPDRKATREQFMPYMKHGFPWHFPEQVREPCQPADEWWDNLLPMFANAFIRGAGFDRKTAGILAAEVRQVYLETDDWKLFDDTIPTLDKLSENGWTHFILTNHVPEFGDILQLFGLDEYISIIFNSAHTGVEKPNPLAFQNVLNEIETGSPVWMIGDNPKADIAGAEAVGIQAILVRRYSKGYRYYCENLAGIEEIINKA